jgi:hypothetical protein
MRVDLAPMPQLVVRLVPTNFLLEAARRRVFVDDQQFCTDHRGEIG